MFILNCMNSNCLFVFTFNDFQSFGDKNLCIKEREIQCRIIFLLVYLFGCFFYVFLILLIKCIKMCVINHNVLVCNHPETCMPVC